MPTELPAPGSPADWLRHALSDLELASARKTSRVLYEHLCFHAQQAAEKAIKAVLVAHGVNVHRTHDLAFLLEQLPVTVNIPQKLTNISNLTKYAVQFRYPVALISANASDRCKAVKLGQAAVNWAKAEIHSKQAKLF